MTRPVAVLRPAPGDARTAARIEALGLVAIGLPLFAVAPVAWSPPSAAAYDALVATSANAFRHGGEGLAALRRLPVIAVGAATAAAARDAGFAVEAVGDGDAAALAGRIAGRPALHLAGRERRPLAGTDAVVVYAAEPLSVAPAALARLDGTVALLHSPRAARRLAELVARPARGAVRIAALSPAVAAAAGDGWGEVAAAPRPSDDALLPLALRMANRGD